MGEADKRGEGGALRALLDATAVVALMLSPPTRLEGLSELSTLDLAFYEVGNAVWKAARIHKSFDEEDGLRAIRTLKRLMENLKVIPFREAGASEILTLGVRRGLTFYDSSYLAMALGRDLTLVTDDEELARAAEDEGVEVIRSDQLLRMMARGPS